jgi:hypothetical protein
MAHHFLFIIWDFMIELDNYHGMEVISGINSNMKKMTGKSPVI